MSAKSHMSTQDCVDDGEAIPVSVRTLGRDEHERMWAGVVVEQSWVLSDVVTSASDPWMWSW